MGGARALLAYGSGFVHLTGGAHVAAGLAMLAGVVPQSAATLKAAMIAAFTVMVCLPRVVRAPGSRFERTAMCVSGAIAAGCAVVAGSYRNS